MAQVSTVLKDYAADREPIVIDRARLHSCCRHLTRHLGKAQPSRLNRQRLARYLRQRVREGVQPQTVRREFITLRGALPLAWKDGKLRRVPPITLPLKGQPRQRILSLPEIRRLRAVVKDQLPLRLFVELGLAHGARKMAILELTWDRVSFEINVIDYRCPHPKASRRKNRAVVPLVDPALIRLLTVAYRRRRGDRVVEMSVTQLERQFRKAAESARLTGVTPHVFRHTVVTVVTRRKSLERASKLVGHKSMAITEEVYDHLKVGDLKPAARSMAQWLKVA